MRLQEVSLDQVMARSRPPHDAAIAPTSMTFSTLFDILSDDLWPTESTAIPCHSPESYTLTQDCIPENSPFLSPLHET
ncbi:hypothetical protein BST61_g10221 [Cercospora zeina]